MMKLSTMQEVMVTVNDSWESSLADELLLHWEHDKGHAKFWRASANFVFFFKKSGKDHVLRFNQASERTAGIIQAEIDYVRTLAGLGINVAKPVQSLSGNLVETVSTSLGQFHAVVFEALKGKQFELEELTPEQFARWGKALGELHDLTMHDPTPGRPSWEDHLAFVAEGLGADQEVARQALGKLKNALNQLSINEQNFGLIHFDFELDNVIWDGENPGIIDFDDCAWYWLVADIAFALRDLFGERADNVDLQNESFLHFIEGYRRVREIEQEELALIPLFFRLSNLISFVRLQRTMTPVNPAGELPWMAALRDKLTAKMQFYQDELSLPLIIIS